ncbi:MAG: DUF969 domain-containing protein [Spirochaetales bacterium]|nr:DUF969 domain-containing protein [Spirochaetales bacterium]
MLKLIGILIILIGFIRKYDTIATVLIAGLVTGLVSGMGFVEILGVIGKSFIDTRYMTIFFITLPIIGILERNGLKEQASRLISKMKQATAGRVMSVYTLIRTMAAAFSLRLGGHVQFIRPIVNPMANGAVESQYGSVNEEAEEIIKGYSAASENYGNFFGQNVFIASGGVLLVVGTLEELGIQVTAAEVSKSALPVAIISLILAFIQNSLLDRRLGKVMKKKSTEPQKEAI